MARLLTSLDNMKLQTRISLLVTFGLLVTLGLLTLVSVRVVQETTDEIVRERLVLAGVIASHVDSVLNEVRLDLTALPSLASFDPDRSDLVLEQQAMAHSFAKLGRYVDALILLDTQGKIVLSLPSTHLPVGTDISSETFAKEVTKESEINISNAFLLKVIGKPAVAVTLPIKDGSGKLVSYLSALIYLDGSIFASLLGPSTRIGQTGHADIVDTNDKVLASTDSADLLLAPHHPQFYRRMLVERKAQVLTTSGNDNHRYAGARHVMAYVPLESTPWGLGLGADEADTFASVRRIQLQSGFLGLLSILGALALARYSTSKVVRPVRTLIGASERMASGDLATPIKVQGGDEVGRLAAAFDEMRLRLQAAYQDLTVEKSRYQGIFRAMADPVFTVDTARRITSLNPAAERLLGYSSSEAAGLSCADFLQARDGAVMPSCQSSCPLTSDIDWQKASSISTEVVCGLQGNKAVVEGARAPIYDDQGALVGVVHVLRDISQAEELSQMKEQFLSNVSHELRSPLGFVKGYATTLLRGDAHWKERTRLKFLREILYASDKLERLVNELLDTSRLQAHAFSTECQPTQIKPIVDAAAKWVKAQPNRHKFAVSLPHSLPMVLADSRRTEQMLRNLLENAVKYSPNGGSISISGAVEDGMVIVSVTDEGLGIPEDQVEHIFERFHRTNGGLAAQIGGVGIGLSICRSIAEAQGGRIWVKSTYGSGSTFYFSVPVLELPDSSKYAATVLARRSSAPANDAESGRPNAEGRK